MRSTTRRRGFSWLALAVLAAAGAVVALVVLEGDEAPETSPVRASDPFAVVVGGPPGAAAADATPLVGPAETLFTPPAGPGYAIDPAPASERIELPFRKQPPRSALLWDIDTGEVLWRRNADRVLAIASVTKMMTGLVVVENARASERVKITKEALAYEGSGVGLLPRQKTVRLETMLYGLMLPSGNDAAIALAIHVGGSQKRFVGMMNERAQRMGLSCTHFFSASGIDDRDSSCATDLARMAREVLAKPRLAKVVGSRSVVLPFPIKGGKLHLSNNNRLMRQGYPGIDGIKTGYTEKAGRCLVASVRRRGIRLGVVLLHSPDPPLQAKILFGRGFTAMRAART